MESGVLFWRKIVHHINVLPGIFVMDSDIWLTMAGKMPHFVVS